MDKLYYSNIPYQLTGKHKTSTPSMKFKNGDKFGGAYGGYTLVELLVVIIILFVLFSLGIARYRDFQRRQSLNAAARTLISDLRFAQERALAGAKPSGCVTLNSYILRRLSSTGYHILANCTNSSYVVVSESQVGFSSKHPNITLANFSDVVFNILGGGVSANVTVTLTQANTAATRAVTVTTGGEIK